MSKEPQQPVKEFRIGGTITASIWRNETKGGDRTIVNHSVQVQKRYYDEKDKVWKTSHSYFPSDLPRVQLALQKAYEWIMIDARHDQAADVNNEAA